MDDTPTSYPLQEADEPGDATVVLTDAELKTLRRMHAPHVERWSFPDHARDENPTLTIPRSMLDAYAELDRTAHAHRQWSQARRDRTGQPACSGGGKRAPAPHDASPLVRPTSAYRPNTQVVGDDALSHVWFGPARNSPIKAVRFLESSGEFIPHPTVKARNRDSRRGLRFAGWFLGGLMLVALAFTITSVAIQ